MEEYITVKLSLLKPIIFHQYFTAMISTVQAAEILRITVPEFVKEYEDSGTALDTE